MNLKVQLMAKWILIRPYAKKRTEQLAKLGYVALAINMYGKRIRPQNPKKSVAQAVISR